MTFSNIPLKDLLQFLEEVTAGLDESIVVGGRFGKHLSGKPVGSKEVKHLFFETLFQKPRQNWSVANVANFFSHAKNPFCGVEQ